MVPAPVVGCDSNTQKEFVVVGEGYRCYARVVRLHSIEQSLLLEVPHDYIRVFSRLSRRYVPGQDSYVNDPCDLSNQHLNYHLPLEDNVRQDMLLSCPRKNTCVVPNAKHNQRTHYL
jgi:hypothetical protein